jgi:hypothetical protein
MLASDLIALGVAIVGVAVGSVLSPRVRRTVLELAKGPWYVPSIHEGLELTGPGPLHAVTPSFWADKARTISAVATAIVVLQAGASMAATELAINSGRQMILSVTVVTTEA